MMITPEWFLVGQVCAVLGGIFIGWGLSRRR